MSARRDQARVHAYPRAVRVAEVVREVIAEELERLSDPRLGLVTLSGVEVSPDLHHARAFYSVLTEDDPEEERAEAAAALRAAAPRLRGTLGKQVRLKYLPEVEFIEDPALVEGRRIEEILQHLHTRGGPSGD